MKKSPELTEKILCHIPSNACIVDVGCGDGEFLSSLAGQGYRLIGVDPLIEQATSGEPAFFKGTAEALPLPDHVADVMVMQCVFSLCDPEPACKEIKRVLKADGILIMTDLLSGTVSVDFTRESISTPDFLSSDPAPSYNRSDSVPSETAAGLGRILTRKDLEETLTPHFSLVAFSDEKAALLQMLIEAIFSDEELCISKEEQDRLKALKAGYGLWVWKVKANES